MFLLVPAHTGCPRQNQLSDKMVVVVVVDGLFYCGNYFNMKV